jgi:hypothetical protein
MELLRGEDLTTVLAGEGRLDPKRAARLVGQACSALRESQEHFIIHGDLKTSDIFIVRSDDGSEQVKLLGFGMAKLRRALRRRAREEASLTSSDLYTAPEQIGRTTEPEESVDIYALGVILYELLTGEVPFTAANLGALEVLVANEDPRTPRSLVPTIDAPFEDVALKAMARERWRRYSSLAAMAADLVPLGAEPRDDPLSPDMGIIGRPVTAEDIERAIATAIGTARPVEQEPTDDDTRGAADHEAPGEASEASQAPATLSDVEGRRGAHVGVGPAADNKLWTWFVGLLVGATIAALGVLVYQALAGIGSPDGGDHIRIVAVDTDRATDQDRDATVGMTVHVMSRCPYGVKAVQALTPIARGLGDRFVLKLEYIGRVDRDILSSLHGAGEVAGDTIQLCVNRHASYTSWLDFLDCQNEDWRSIPAGWERCAESAGVDVEAIRSCSSGDEGTRLLRASFEASKKAGARGSPTIFLSGERYRGGRSTTSLARAICAAYEDRSRPGYCGSVAPAPEVPVTILFDRRCSHDGCDTTRAERDVARLLAGAVVTRVDFDSGEGRDLYERSGVKLLPALLIGTAIDDDEDVMAAIRRKARRHGDFYVERLGRFDPVAGEWRERPVVGIRYLTDARCKTRECEALARFDAFLRTKLPGAKIVNIDSSTPEGQSLWRELAARSPDGPAAADARPLGLPIVLFDAGLEEEEELFARLSARLHKVGDEHMLQIGTWDPESGTSHPRFTVRAETSSR